MPAPQDPVPILNGTDEDIPSHAVVEPTGVVVDGAMTVRKPTADGFRGVWVNREGVVPAGERGQATRLPGVTVLVDGEPAVGDEWGAQADSWKLGDVGGGGFVVNSEVVNGRVNAVRFGGTATTNSADCRSPLAGLRRDEQVVFAIPSGYGVDTATMSGFWSADAPGGAGWMSAGTVRTSDGDTTLVLIDKADGGKGLRLVGETQTWYGEDIDCQDCGRLFAAALTPPELETEGSASGGSGGTPCADHTFRVCVKCRAPVLYTGCQAVPEGVVCWKLWHRDLFGVWHAYDAGSYGPSLRWFPSHSSGLSCEATTSMLNRCGWYVPGYSVISGNPAAISLMALYSAADGGWIWGTEGYFACASGYAAVSQFQTPPGFDPSDLTDQLVPGSYTVAPSQPAPTDRPWRLRLGAFAYIQAYFSEEECEAIPEPPPLPPPPPPPPGPPPPPPPPPGGGCCDGEGEGLEGHPNLVVEATDGPLSTSLGAPFIWLGSQYFLNTTSVFAALTCSGGTWTITVNGGAYTATPTSVSCGPPFGLIFDNSELGGTGDATITLESP